jgi:hypothetical protein
MKRVHVARAGALVTPAQVLLTCAWVAQAWRQQLSLTGEGPAPPAMARVLLEVEPDNGRPGRSLHHAQTEARGR